MSYRLYLRDWYFNAGIIGFLTIAANGKGIDSIPSLTVGENYIEFDNDIFDGFEEKFLKHGFLKFFNIQAYLQRFQKVHKDLTDKKSKVKPEQIVKKIEEIEKYPYENFLKLLGISITEYKTTEDFLANLESAKKRIESFSKEEIYRQLNSTPEGKMSLEGFVKWRFKGICSYDRITDYIEGIKNSNMSVKIKNNDLCPSCQERKAEYEFNNAVSNIIGFNKDNSNWIWDFKPSKMKICPFCSLIYTCAFASFSFVQKKVDGDYLNYFYFPNENTNLRSLYETVARFNLEIENIKDNTSILYLMIKQTVKKIITKQSKSIAENLNFIEIVDNPTLGGQSSKGYNVYNYNISPDTAEFLEEHFKADTIPKGYYIIKGTYYNLDEELLKYTIEKRINYSLLNKYFTFHLNQDKYSPKYNLIRVVKYVFGYIQKVRGESMERSEKIIGKGFRSGITLRDELLKKGKENQINGLVYNFLNDLKIADREKFLDKYIRIIMAHNLPNSFGKEEMLDEDCFLQFGYSFVNGLMMHKEVNSNSESSEKEE